MAPRDPRPISLAAPVLRSEGQARFLQVVGTLAAIAADLGVKSPQSVADWRTGAKVPAPETRQRIAAMYGIPERAWLVLPGHSLDDASAPTGAPTAPGAASPTTHKDAAPSTLQDCLDLLAVIRKDRQQPGLLPTERVRLADAEAKILTLRARLEGSQELSEDRYVRQHPAFRRFCDLVIDALEPHPLAAKAVHEAIQRAFRDPSSGLGPHARYASTGAVTPEADT
jgi:transcriptional regulator with XRE-family HTH domain